MAQIYLATKNEINVIGYILFHINMFKLKKNKEKLQRSSAIIFLTFCAAFIFAFAALVPGAAWSGSFDKLPVKGMVTMIDLGAKKCIPCRMMMPIMEKMEELYKDRAVINFIDVWENHDQTTRFRIRAIPIQIFFDKKGKEVYRHVGFLDEKSIKAQLLKMGIEPAKG